MPRLSYEDVLSYGLVPDNIEEFHNRHNPEDETFSFTDDELIDHIETLAERGRKIQAERERVAAELMDRITPDTISVQGLARRIGVSRQTLYTWRDNDQRRRESATDDDTAPTS